MKPGEAVTAAKTKLKSILNRTALWVQLAVFMILIITLVSFGLIYKDYTSTRSLTIANQINTTSKILNLEVENLNLYFNTLANFCIQPYYDSEFTRIINQKSPLSAEQAAYVKQQVYYYYYTRSDLRDYELYLINQQISVGRTNSQQHITSQPFLQEDLAEAVQNCQENPLNQCIRRSDSGHLTYYHSLFQVKGKEQQAIVRLELDDSYATQLMASHSGHGEILVFLNEKQDIIFSNDPGLPKNPEMLTQALSSRQLHRDGYETVELSGEPFLLVDAVSASSGIHLLSLTPLSYIDSQIGQLRKSILDNGIMIWLFTILLIYGLVRLLTSPLKALSAQMHRTGDGDFKTHIRVEGSTEIRELSDSFNSMVSHIDRLIQRNYIAELRGKDAKLAALEAQLNPHFLYNTLQAISTEALINDQPQIHRMITALASNLRYTIKGDTLVPVKKELDYVKDYIFLQKMRMDDALDFQICADPSVMDYLIPKISIQTLVENSIIHGKSAEKGTISITVNARYENDQIIVSVKDDGCGISKEQLEKLYTDFDLQKTTGKYGGIGLSNLYSRLRLLYDIPASLDIRTEEGSYTEIILTIPATKELPCTKL